MAVLKSPVAVHDQQDTGAREDLYHAAHRGVDGDGIKVPVGEGVQIEAGGAVVSYELAAR